MNETKDQFVSFRTRARGHRGTKEFSERGLTNLVYKLIFLT